MQKNDFFFSKNIFFVLRKPIASVREEWFRKSMSREFFRGSPKRPLILRKKPKHPTGLSAPFSGFHHPVQSTRRRRSDRKSSEILSYFNILKIAWGRLWVTSGRPQPRSWSRPTLYHKLPSRHQVGYELISGSSWSDLIWSDDMQSS